MCGVGISTLAVGIGGVQNPPGSTVAVVNEWNGTSWAVNPNAYPTAYYSMAGAGTATASIFTGGDPAATTVNTFDGTSFTGKTAMNTGRRGHMSAGTTTAAIVAGGETPRTANTEIWNGSAWTETGNLGETTQDISGWGTSTDAMSAAGYGATANVANAEYWNGTTWTEVADIATARNSCQIGGIGASSPAGMITGGALPTYTTATEEWSAPSTVTVAGEGQVWYNSSSKVLKGFGQFMSSGTWSSGAPLPTGYNGISGFGTSTGAIMAGSPAPTGFSYDGTSWTTTPSLNDSGSSRYYPGSLGIVQNAGMILGAEGSNQPSSETWNGSAWTQGNALTTGRDFMGGCGTTTAGLITGGVFPTTTPVANTETYDGTSWSETTNFPTVMMGGQLGGTQTAAINATGANNPGTSTMELPSYDWDGTSWSSGPSINTGRHMGGGDSPSASLMLIYGGLTPPATYRAQTEFYDGTAWTELADLATARRSYGACGTHTAALFAGGTTGSNSDATEEWATAPSIKTFTAS